MAEPNELAQLRQKLDDPETFKAVPNEVDVQFLFNAKEHPQFWTEVDDTILADLQSFESSASGIHIQNNTDGDATVSVSVDIDPRFGVRLNKQHLTAPRFVIEFRELAVMTSTPGVEVPVSDMTKLVSDTSARQGYNAGVHNLWLVLKHAKNVRDVLALARNWNHTGELYVGLVHPTLSMVPEVASVTWVEADNTLHIKIIEHRNLPFSSKEHVMRTMPGGMFQTECGQYLKLTYSQADRLKTRFFKVRGGLPENTFPKPLPTFDLSELPA